MNSNENNFVVIFLSFLFMSAGLGLCRMTFEISKFHTCPPQDSKFLSFVDRSVEQCVEECTKRKSCAVVGYKRLLRLCELYTNITSSTVANNHSIMISRKDMNKPPQKCKCEDWSVCETESRHCINIKECPLLSYIGNGTILGNMHHTGAKKTVKCAPGFFETNYISSVTCEKSGNWSFTPECEECQADGQVLRGFKVYKNRTTQADARTVCVAQGAHLVRIDKPWKKRYIRSVIKTCMDAKEKRYWTDGIKNADGNWKYSNDVNVPQDRIYWSRRKQTGTKGSCIRMQKNLLEFPCERNIRFICEFD